MATATRYKHTDVPRQAGELARFKVVQGPDFGAVYIVTGEKATVGRGENNDIVVSDLKASRGHAEAVFTGGAWKIRDLGSVNGILHNGKQTKEAPLRTGDTVTLGETTLEFMGSAEAGTMMLKAPAKTVQEVQQNQAVFDDQKARIKKMTSFGSLGELAAGLKGGDTGGVGKEQRRKMIIYAAAGLMLLWTMMDDSKTGHQGRGPAGRKDAKKADAELEKYLPGASDSPEVAKTSEMLFRLGFREYREGNYIRAKSNFETVLQVDPGHRLARLYMTNCEQAIERSVKENLESGKKDFTTGKLRSAKGHFEETLRLLFYDQANPAYKEAQEQLAKVNEELKGKF